MEDQPPFVFEAVFLRKYPGMCIQCGHQVCICPSIPESTVGRLAKELDIPVSENLFGLDPTWAEERGRRVGESVLQDLGGLPAIADQLPLDRGEANQALVLLCLRLSQELLQRDQALARALQEAAIQIATDTRHPGTRAHGLASGPVLELLGRVWPLLNLAVIPDDRSLPARLGALLRVQAVRIGVVTALPKEFAAMRMMLDEEAPNAVNGDPNDYVLGRIPSLAGTADHLVVVTLLKEMGNNSAASAATNLLRSYPQVEDILIVGIAGGIPSPETPDSHVRLGDVVVSHKDGVIQYDNLKLESGSVRVRSNTSKPSSRMIGAINFLESERLMKKFPWEKFVSRATSLENAARPDDDSDVLFESSGGGSRRVPHPVEPGRRARQPKIHLGRVGAANILLKNRSVRDQLRKEHAIIAIEMEGSGIADAAWNAGQHYLVIRGIAWLPLVLAVVWLCGAMTVLLVWYARWRQVSAILRRAAPMEDGRELTILRRLHNLSGEDARITLVRSRELMEPRPDFIVRGCYLYRYNWGWFSL